MAPAKNARAVRGPRPLRPLGPVTCVAKCHHDRPPQRFLGQRPAQWSDDYPKPRPVGRSLRDIGLVKSIAYPAKSRSSFSRRPGTRKRFSFRSGADPHDLPHRSLTTGTGNPASPKAATHARCHRSVSGRGQFGQSEVRPPGEWVRASAKDGRLWARQVPRVHELTEQDMSSSVYYVGRSQTEISHGHSIGHSDSGAKNRKSFGSRFTKP